MVLHLLKFPYRKILDPLAKSLHGVHPDIVSYTALAIAAGSGWSLYAGHLWAGWYLIAVGLTLLRMTLNTLDGVMAIARGNMSLRGEIVNALPDRYADLFVLIGITLSPHCVTWLGLAALATMVLVSYSGMLGKALGVTWQQQGPMDKVERLVLIMVAALVQFIVIVTAGPATRWLSLTPLEWGMAILILLGQFTIYRRVRGQVRQIDVKEGRNRDKPAESVEE